MTRETKIGLLVGLAFIVLFGLILGGHTNPMSEPPGGMVAGNESSGEGVGAGTLHADGHPPAPAPGPVSHDPRPAPVTPPAPRVGEPPGTPDDMDNVIRTSERARRDELDLALRTRTLEPGHPAPADPVTPPRDNGNVNPPPPVGRTYVVVAGDSLYKIARKVYGEPNAMQYKKILEANRAKLPDESSLKVGQQLAIPDLEGLPADRARRPGRRRPAYRTDARQHRSAPRLGPPGRRACPGTSAVAGRWLPEPAAPGGTDADDRPAGQPDAHRGGWGDPQRHLQGQLR